MTQRLLVALLGAILITSPALFGGQSEQPGSVQVYGSGLLSCGSFTQMEESNINHWQVLSWVAGWVSAAGNYSLTWATDVRVATTDPGAIGVWITNYCATHPLETVAESAAVLVDELRMRAARGL